MTAVLLIALGGALGAMLRAVMTSADGEIPWAMMLVNVAASGGAAALSDLDGEWRWLINVGLLGALSTWSSLAVAVANLLRAGRIRSATMVMFGTVAGSIAAAAAVLA